MLSERECRRILARQTPKTSVYIFAYYRSEEHVLYDFGRAKTIVHSTNIGGLISVEDGRFSVRPDAVSKGRPFTTLSCWRCTNGWENLSFNWDDDVPQFDRYPLCEKCRGFSWGKALGWRGRALLWWKRRHRSKQKVLSSGPYR